MRGIAKYKARRVESAPPQQVVLMLFQEAVHRLTQAAQAMETGDSTIWRKNLHHVREIFFELLGALDDDAAPELCAGLRGLYRWAIQELIAAGRDTNQGKVLDVLRVTTSLLEGWQGALKRMTAGQAP